MSASSASSTKPSAARSWGQLLPPALFIACVAFSWLGLWQGLDRGLSDFLVKIKVTAAPLPQSPKINPVDLTDSALRNLGESVSSRQAFLDLLTVMGEGELSGAMDLLFQNRGDPTIDAAMAKELDRAASLVLAIVPVPADLSRFTGKGLSDQDAKILRSQLWHPRRAQPGSIPTAATFLLPNPTLGSHAKHWGHIGLMPDGDGLYRKIPLFYRWEDGYIPSFALAIAAEELKIDISQVEIVAGSHVLLPLAKGKDIRIPIDQSGYAWIPYPRLWENGWKRTPLDKVVAQSRDPNGMEDLINQWSGGIVIAADLTTGQKDFGSTPVEAVYPLTGIHSSLLNGILTNTFFSSMDFTSQLLIAIVVLGGVFWIHRAARGPWLHLGFAALLVLWAGIACWLWFQALILPWFFGPALGLVVAWVSALGLRILKSREERLLLESALSRYFPRALAARVLEEKKVDLTPVSKELTILFADIVGFTKWSADKSPQLVHDFLSDYLESMAAILFEHGGTVDKFMGDGILAFFGDPFDQPDHAERCLRAALAMQVKAEDLRHVWLPQAGIDLKIRIGINSGPVIVGNLGSQTRIEYTVIGSVVNLGQRMESNAPEGGVLVSETTWAKTKDSFSFGETRSVIVKGYDKPVAAYVLDSEKPD